MDFLKRRKDASKNDREHPEWKVLDLQLAILKRFQSQIQEHCKIATIDAISNIGSINYDLFLFQ